MDSTDYPMMNVNFDDTAGFNNNEVSESELITSIDGEEILQNAEDEEDDLAVERATIVSVLDEEEYEFTTIINLEESTSMAPRTTTTTSTTTTSTTTTTTSTTT